ncbi:MAG: 4'-phosphopantetheinyl transferase [Bacillota bacterium]|nr:MAG: 4'-phosphopantetheinyl transferase [Bacillota bacterium]
MILGIGIDLVSVERIRGVVERRGARWLERVFSPAERQDAGTGPHRWRRLAARWAAKEAFAKALGTGVRGFRWRDIEVRRDADGRPVLHLTGAAAERLRAAGVVRVHLSLSHDSEWAVAQVILEGGDGHGRPSC